jgi:predicted PurR-regulated permease PerM
MVRILSPFATPLLLGAIVATFTYRPYRAVVARLRGRRNAAAVVMLVAVTLVIFIPAIGLAILLVQQATTLIRLFQETDVQAVIATLRLQERADVLRNVIPGFDPATLRLDESVMVIVREIPGFVAKRGALFLAGFANLALGLVLMLLALYYFYIDGENLLRQLRYLSPLPDAYDDAMFIKFRGVIDATFRGQFLTAFAQGAVTSIGLAIAQVPGAIFWGAVAAVFALIPMVGAALVWIPAAIYLFARAAVTGSGVGYAIFLIIWGVAVVSVVDNLIRPWAMRSGTQMPAVVLLFSILGGVQAFGMMGLVLGPLVFALFVTVVDIYRGLIGDPIASADRRSGDSAV